MRPPAVTAFDGNATSTTRLHHAALQVTNSCLKHSASRRQSSVMQGDSNSEHIKQTDILTDGRFGS